MRKARRGGVEPRAKPKQIDNSLFVARFYKNTAKSYGYTPRKCEFCPTPLAWHDRQEETDADGRYLCAECRAEYMDLHHSDPFCLTGGIAA